MPAATGAQLTALGSTLAAVEAAPLTADGTPLTKVERPLGIAFALPSVFVRAFGNLKFFMVPPSPSFGFRFLKRVPVFSLTADGNPLA